MKSKELRPMGEEDLLQKLSELEKELMKHNSQIAAGTTPKSPGQVRQAKKTVAKILTILGQKQKMKAGGTKA